MFDLKTLKTLDEALDMARDYLLEENASKEDSPFAQSLIKAQEKIRREIHLKTANITHVKRVVEAQRSRVV